MLSVLTRHSVFSARCDCLRKINAMPHQFPKEYDFFFETVPHSHTIAQPFLSLNCNVLSHNIQWYIFVYLHPSRLPTKGRNPEEPVFIKMRSKKGACKNNNWCSLILVWHELVHFDMKRNIYIDSDCLRILLRDREDRSNVIIVLIYITECINCIYMSWQWHWLHALWLISLLFHYNTKMI